MNEETCRYIESKCGKPIGWMDAPHGAAPGRPAVAGSVIDAEVMVRITQALQKLSLEDQHLALAQVENIAVVASSGMPQGDSH